VTGIDIITSRARQAQLLERRIAENVASQEIDYLKWLFTKLVVKEGGHVLELCCGSGEQTSRLLDLVGETGQVVALDISGEVLDHITSRLNKMQLSRLTLIESDMDELTKTLDKAGFQIPHFDVVFCAYGLYYSTRPERVLQEAKRWLTPRGSIAVVGPFGSNNGPLFNLLKQSLIDLPTSVKYSSQDFMWDKVIPWATHNFHTININTVVNRIRWNSPESILAYWKSSTFYQSEKLKAVQEQINNHFRGHSEFVNEKWIMAVEMSDVRS
jgi:ubiquinone/menaquinone biosynthesis C-methylase UbiE